MRTPRVTLGIATGRRMRGFTLMEVMFAMTVAILMGATIIESLLFSQRIAARTRLYTNARAIVQRNLDAATGVAFTGTACASGTSILKITGTAGLSCDDDGGTGVLSENIQVLKSGSNVAVTVVSGTLTRIVSSEPVYVTGTTSADPNALVMRITFKVDYDYLSHHYTYSETTLRSVDSQ